VYLVKNPRNQINRLRNSTNIWSRYWRDFSLKFIKMFEKKPNIIKSPDLSKLREVIIDHRTKIYIAPDADIEKARERYFERLTKKKA
jgi:hypothetical protein